MRILNPLTSPSSWSSTDPRKTWEDRTLDHPVAIIILNMLGHQFRQTTNMYANSCRHECVNWVGEKDRVLQWTSTIRQKTCECLSCIADLHEKSLSIHHVKRLSTQFNVFFWSGEIHHCSNVLTWIKWINICQGIQDNIYHCKNPEVYNYKISIGASRIRCLEEYFEYTPDTLRSPQDQKVGKKGGYLKSRSLINA